MSPRHETPAPASHTSAEVRAAVAEHQNHCPVWEEIGKMRTEIASIRSEQDQARGAAKEAAAKTLRAVQVLTGIAALSTVATFILNHWPHR